MSDLIFVNYQKEWHEKRTSDSTSDQADEIKHLESLVAQWKALAIEAIDFIEIKGFCNSCGSLLNFEPHSPDCVVTRICELAEKEE
jgi:hypothetical protein